MQNWFCSGFCGQQNEKQHEIVLANNRTQQVFNYVKSSNQLQKDNLTHGFIMMKKSFHDEHLRNCQKDNKQFTDQQFPPEQKSLSQNIQMQAPELKNRGIVWRRISDLYKNCDLVKDKIEPTDIQQGNVGDCYFLAAISALAQNQSNILQIFQKKNASLMKKNQFGIYKVVVNVAGQPQQIVVDDYIPVFSKSQRPVFCKPINNQFWVVLLQKVWAKINKSYANISSGNPHQVLNKFSVAPVFYYNIFKRYYQSGQRLNYPQVQMFQQNLWNQIIQGHNQNFPMCCGSRNRIFAEGIKQSHTYTLLGAYQVASNGKNQRILKLRNPWGNTEYTGKFSQNDKIWESINAKIRTQIFQKRENDGIFLIPYEIFLINFQSIDICHCKQKYNYIFRPISFNEQFQKYFKLYVKQQGEVYLTFETNYNKNVETHKYQENGISKIMIVQQIDNGQYQCIDSSLQTSLADVSVRCKKLKAGNYIIMVQNQATKHSTQTKIYSKHSKKATLSAYSDPICILSEIPPVKKFLFDFFRTHAIKYNFERKKVGSFQNDWIAKKLLQQSGYGYICISLDPKGSKYFEISINQRLIFDQGYKLQFFPQNFKEIGSPNNQEIKMLVQPGNVFTFLFKIDFKKEDLKLSFPPRGFEIKKII